MKLESYIWAAFIWATAHMAFRVFYYNLGLELDWIVIWFILNIAIAKTLFCKQNQNHAEDGK